jgi:uncharacterized Zn finger protein (UPF0148 family)
MSSCYKCGAGFTGYGSVCPVCKQTEVIKEQSEKQLRAQSEYAMQQQKTADLQMGIARASAAFNAAMEVQKVEELKKQTSVLEEHAALQTKLLLEQSVSDELAYEQGFNLKNQICTNESRINSEVIFNHQIELVLDFHGTIEIESIQPDFATPRLKISFINGVKDRLKRDFSEPVADEILSSLSYDAGFNILNNNYGFINGGQIINLIHSINLEDGDEILIYSENIHCEFYFKTDLITGKVLFDTKTPRVLPKEKLNVSFMQGVEDYVKSINTNEQCQQRLAKYHSNEKLRNQANDRNASREDRNRSALQQWESNNKSSIYIEIILKLLALLPAVWLWNNDHGFFAFIYALIYLSLIGKRIPDNEKPIAEAVEEVPPFVDPLIE